MSNKLLRVAILGAGNMGSQLALLFAMNNYLVVVWDAQNRSVSEGNINKALLSAIARKKIAIEEKENLLARITFLSDLSDIGECVLILEAISENLEDKCSLFLKIDKICGYKTILASNTSSIDLEVISKMLSNPERFIGLHFFNPPLDMKLVEIGRLEMTSEETLKDAEYLTSSLNKKAVIVSKSPGYIVNRLLMPLINDASRILMDGSATAAQIDTAMRFGANHPMGPLALGDLIGLDITVNILEELSRRFNNDKFIPSPLLYEKVASGKLGRKTLEGFYIYEQ